jgi:hypothetical protein
LFKAFLTRLGSSKLEVYLVGMTGGFSRSAAIYFSIALTLVAAGLIMYALAPHIYGSGSLKQSGPSHKLVQAGSYIFAPPEAPAAILSPWQTCDLDLEDRLPTETRPCASLTPLYKPSGTSSRASSSERAVGQACLQDSSEIGVVQGEPPRKGSESNSWRTRIQQQGALISLPESLAIASEGKMLESQESKEEALISIPESPAVVSQGEVGQSQKSRESAVVRRE